MSDINLLLVSDIHHFSTLDVYNGYVEAFNKLGVPFDVVPLHELTTQFSLEYSMGLGLSKMLRVDNSITHVLFTCGLAIPDWFYQSKYDKKIGVLATDDPHASKVLMDKKQYIDYYFTNEKMLEDNSNGIYYVPTATSHMLPSFSKENIDEAFKSDIIFIGTVYDDRIKPLEDICQFCLERGLNMKIIGPLCKTPKDSIIQKYAENVIIDNKNTKLYYYGSKIVVNIDRNVNWNPSEETGNSLLIDVGKPYSLNPRFYEIAGCRTTQLYVNPRQEAKDLFGDNVFYSTYDNVTEVLDQILNTDIATVNDKIENCYNIVRNEHFYLHRALRVLDILKSGE